MSKTTVMTLRVPVGVRRALERVAAQLGYKPAHLGARFVEEGLRRRDYPLIELRETAAGRVAYLRGTRLTVCWVVEQIRARVNAEKIARDAELSAAQVQAALAYAEAFPDEIDLDIEESEANRRWLQIQEAGWRAGHAAGKTRSKTKSGE